TFAVGPWRPLRWALLASIAAAGCAGNGSQKGAAARGESAQIQSQTMAFAERYLLAMADVYDQVQQHTKAPETALVIVRSKLLAGSSAVGHACEPNPLVGLMDMSVMVTINLGISERQWAVELFGEQNAAAIVARLKQQEKDIWGLA